jgi:hypothetical protein
VYIGSSTFLLAVGAVLRFGVRTDHISQVDLPVVGYILMACGALGLVLSLVLAGPRTRRTRTVIAQDPAMLGRPGHGVTDVEHVEDLFASPSRTLVDREERG